MHSCEMIPLMDNWKSTAVHINSRCGFCAKRFTVWQERVDHLTAHFKSGARMSEWKGCRGLDPAVAAQVTNAMPPYLIGIESVSPIPFSAANRATWRSYVPQTEPELGNLSGIDNMNAYQDDADMTGLPVKATCWEILTVRLGQYANEMSKRGHVLTDEMLQAQARRILYDDDDTWNQTAADNPEWLDLFKKAHGLDFIPSDVGGQGQQIPEDLETYQDLGLRVPFAVQLQAFNAVEARNAQEEDIERKLWSILSKEGVLHDSSKLCRHNECEDNVLDSHAVEGQDSTHPRQFRWCTYELPPSEIRTVKALTRTARSQDLDDERLLDDENAERARNLALSLESLHNIDNRGPQRCPWDNYENKIAQAKASARGLNALPAIEEQRPDRETGRQPFFPRHRYQLPEDRARHFETVTGPWQDSGTMPTPITTLAPPTIENVDSISSGAMMEFLGSLGQHLPFSSDAATSEIPLLNINPTSPSNKSPEEVALDAEVDRLILESTMAETTQSIIPETSDWTSASMVQPLAAGEFEWDHSMSMVTGNGAMLGMGHQNDMEMDFDGVFDMPLDDTFDYTIPQQ